MHRKNLSITVLYMYYVPTLTDFKQISGKEIKQLTFRNSSGTKRNSKACVTQYKPHSTGLSWIGHLCNDFSQISHLNKQCLFCESPGKKTKCGGSPYPIQKGTKTIIQYLLCVTLGRLLTLSMAQSYLQNGNDIIT